MTTYEVLTDLIFNLLKRADLETRAAVTGAGSESGRRSLHRSDAFLEAARLLKKKRRQFAADQVAQKNLCMH